MGPHDQLQGAHPESKVRLHEEAVYSGASSVNHAPVLGPTEKLPRLRTGEPEKSAAARHIGVKQRRGRQHSSSTRPDHQMLMHLRSTRAPMQHCQNVPYFLKELNDVYKRNSIFGQYIH